MKRHEHWRKEYQENRYMEHLSLDEISTRAQDVFRNSLILTEDGRIGLRPISTEGEYWMIMFTHILEETIIRGSGMPQMELYSPDIVPEATWPHIPNAVNALNGKKYKDGHHLFKYGNKKYLKSMYESGSIRVMPATYYKDASLNSAIHDDERVLSIHHHPSKINISHQSKNTGEIVNIKPIGNVTVKHELTTNYYVYCMSYVYDFRLFDDFRADACIVINDIKGFLSKIDIAFKKAANGLDRFVGTVTYIDPLNAPNDENTSLFFGKHFKYTYQKETRLVWVPRSKTELLDPIYLDIGPMNEYADYIEL